MSGACLNRRYGATANTSPPTSDGPTPMDARWARTLLYNWRRANVLLVLGVLVVSGWYWLGT